jgi:mono/diheme cytochrome c family protein
VRLPLGLLAVLVFAQSAAAAEPVRRDYAAACGSCHEGNGYGVQRLAERLGKDKARLTTRTDLQPAYIRTIVRRGLLAMPPMSKVEVSDTELDAIVRVLTQRAAPGP